MDPRSRVQKVRKAPLAPGARRIGAASDDESLPSAPSPGPQRGKPKRRKSDSEPRRVVVAEPRKPILRQRGEERTRLVLKGRAEVEGTKVTKGAVETPQGAEPKRKKVKSAKGEQVPRADKTKVRNSLEAPPKASEVVKSAPGAKEKLEKGNEEKKKKKKEKKEKKQKVQEEQRQEEEPEEPEASETEVRAASPLSPPPVRNGKAKKEKKAEKTRNKSEKEKKKLAKQREEEKKQNDAKREAKTRRKEKKSKEVEPQRSKSEDPPTPARHTAEPPASRRTARSKGDKPPEVPRVAEPRERRRRKEARERSESERSDRSDRHRSRRRQRILPPDAWQVWPAGSYHPWSSQLAGAPFGMWPGLHGTQMSEAWLGNMPQVAPGAVEPESDSDSEDGEESEEDLEGRELQVPEDADDDEEEEEVEPPVIVKTTVPAPPKPLPPVAQIPVPVLPPQIAVDDEGSATSQTSEGEESETESQDEDAEIGEAPVARRLIEPLQELDMPKVKWYPPGPVRTRDTLHPSMQRWSGPKVGWMSLYHLDIDPAVQMKSSVQQIREGDGQGAVDPDASEIQVTCNGNPSEALTGGDSGPVVPLLIPRWGNSVSRWTSPFEVEVDDAFRWQKRRLSSTVLRSRRTGRTTAGSGGANPQENPQDPPETDAPSEGSAFLIFLGAVSRSVRLIDWKTPMQLVLPEDVKVDPSKYRGLERNLRQKRRPTGPGPGPKGAGSAKKKAAVKSSPGVPPPKLQAQADPNVEYQAKLRTLMQQLQDGSATSNAVSNFWNSLSPAHRVLFSTEFPQFMPLVGQVGDVQSKAAAPVHMAANMMHLPVPPPPKTPPGVAVPMAVVPGFMATVPAGAFPKAAATKLAPEIIKQQEAAWADRLTFHDGILRADMSSLQLGNAGLARWCQWAPSLLNTLGSVSGAPLSNADLNFSGNAIEDAGLRPLLELLQRCDVHVKCLNLDANRLTEASLVAISDLIAESRLPVEAVHMKDNRVQGSYGLMHLARAIKSNDKYPMFLPEKNRYTPLVLYLAGNMIEKPMQVTQLVKDALDKKFPSLSEERQYWESKYQCPPLQLPCFDKQETSVFQ